MRKPGFHLRVVVVANAIVLVGGFIGCQSGAFNWLSDSKEATKPVTTSSDWTPVKESAATSKQAEPTFMPSTKAVFPGSMQGLVSGLTPVGTFQPAPQDAKKEPPALGTPIPQSPPGNMP